MISQDLMREPEMAVAMRAFPETQIIFNTVPYERVEGESSIGWHDTNAALSGPATIPGALAVARIGGPHLHLVGEILRISTRDKEVFVYCAGSADVPADLSLYRRAFFHLAGLYTERLQVLLEVV